jgi:hypothetical protein
LSRREFTYQFVRIERADDYLKCGWIPHAALDGTGHGMWSVLMEWIECPCGIRQPQDGKSEEITTDPYPSSPPSSFIKTILASSLVT